ncbi:MAG: hypothetical protein IPO21_15965 [Bacteroidales bacterium]|nr:hypothetical protein [Bacteroidales bacterium]
MNSLKTLHAGEGYLVYNSTNETIDFWGQYPNNTPNPLHTGWNLIGVSTNTALPLTALPTGVKIIKDFDSFYEPNNGMSTITELLPGKGYFVKIEN